MLVPVILSGGAGTRLWPVSREGQPKPFMLLPDGESLLAKTYRRAAELLAQGGDIVTVTNRDYYFQSKDHFLAAKLPRQHAHFILEPLGRNTAPRHSRGGACVARALRRRGDDGGNARRPPDSGFRCLCRVGCTGRRAGRGWLSGHLRHPPYGTGNRPWLYRGRPLPGSAWRSPSRAFCRKTRPANRRTLPGQWQVPVEFRDVLLHRQHTAGGARGACPRAARIGRRLRGSESCPGSGHGDATGAECRTLRGPAGYFHRLCPDGALSQGRGGTRLLRLE